MIAYFSMLWGLVVLSLRLILHTLVLPLRLPTALCLRILRVILSLRLLKFFFTPLQFVHGEGVKERRSDTQPFACSCCVSTCTFVLVKQVN
jgi:hypothetical protein